MLPLLDDDRVLLVFQYRRPLDERLWEIPAGKLEPGEAPLACAKRELAEETGRTAATWRELLTFYTTPGFSNERITLFLARDLAESSPPGDRGDRSLPGVYDRRACPDDSRRRTPRRKDDPRDRTPPRLARQDLAKGLAAHYGSPPSRCRRRQREALLRVRARCVRPLPLRCKRASRQHRDHRQGGGSAGRHAG
ncbi:NUDIX hydrolase [Candidatus Bipolaricaulota bacterium]